jgi:hypothetical protein
VKGRIWEKSIAKSELEGNSHPSGDQQQAHRGPSGDPRVQRDPTRRRFRAVEPTLEDVFFSHRINGTAQKAVFRHDLALFLIEMRHWLRQPMVYIFLLLFALLGFGW